MRGLALESVLTRTANEFPFNELVIKFHHLECIITSRTAKVLNCLKVIQHSAQ